MPGTEAFIRCSCDRCGVHNAAQLEGDRVTGCCRNCGWGEMTPLVGPDGVYELTSPTPWDPHLPLATPRA